MLLSRSFRNLMMGTAFAVSLTATQVLAQDAPDGGQLTSREAIALQDQIASLRQQVSQVQNAPMPAPSASSGSSSGNSDSSSLTAQLLERVFLRSAQQRGSPVGFHCCERTGNTVRNHAAFSALRSP